ncbi:MAG TPA: Mov34/MPN/PAD-1 family protein [Candidatus Acidoferrum sp.]|nr:Mov34/MPN/PAD-1 family protein [Candidatus Acidoferrum sp.]
MEVYLSENAFVGLLVSTIEVYRRECFGILLGHRESDRIMVEFAVPYQSAKRNFQEVHMDWHRGQRVQEAVQTTSRWELVGDYHSHPMYGDKKSTTKLSGVDQKDFHDDGTSIIVAINDGHRQQRWGYVKGGLISGSINGYALRIAAYHKEGEVIARVPLVCPYAVGFMAKTKGPTPVEVRPI